MSKRIVDDPSLHGWVEEDGKWVWEGGSTTGHIEDGDTEGQIAIWDNTAGQWIPETTVQVKNYGEAQVRNDTGTARL